MSRIALELFAAVVACAGSLSTGYFCWRVLRNLPAPSSDIPGAVQAPALRRKMAALGFLPFWVGCVSGWVVIALMRQGVLSGDRFHSLQEALVVGTAPLLAGLLYLAVDLAMPPVYGSGSALARRKNAPKGRSLVLLATQLVTATLVVVAGVQFPILSMGPDVTLELGALAVPATVAWLVFATSFAKLLDGLHGAALMLLLFASIAVCSTTAWTNEHFLNAYSAVMIGAVMGSLRFHLYPARVVQAGGATAYVGFMFAVLTVLARQKTVAALLIVLPLALVVLLAGGLILSALERNLLLKKQDD